MKNMVSDVLVNVLGVRCILGEQRQRSSQKHRGAASVS